MRVRRIIGLGLVMAIMLCGCKNVGTENENNQEPSATPSPFVETEEPSGDLPEEDMTIPSDATLNEVRAAVVEKLGENYIANMPYDAATVSEVFGVKPEWYDAGIAEGPMMSVNIDKFLAFHATEGNLANIQNALNDYRDTILADAMQYPMNLVKTQGCLVDTVGEYVFFVMVGFIDDTAYETDEEMITAYKAINESVIETARGIIK